MTLKSLGLVATESQHPHTQIRLGKQINHHNDDTARGQQKIVGALSLDDTGDLF